MNEFSDDCLQLPSMQVDFHYYGKLVIAPLNIVMYNVFTEHGPDLYGKWLQAVLNEHEQMNNEPVLRVHIAWFLIYEEKTPTNVHLNYLNCQNILAIIIDTHLYMILIVDLIMCTHLAIAIFQVWNHFLSTSWMDFWTLMWCSCWLCSAYP